MTKSRFAHTLFVQRLALTIALRLLAAGRGLVNGYQGRY